jgi:glutamate formiminotransferase / 5-formyltetrahydrofolate cyclo-ligase
MALIECVPNLSEGRRTDVIDCLVDAVRRVDEVRVLDVSSDRSHNRSVITMVGSAPSLHTAVLALYEQAIATIDLRSHAGAHPRLGAVDVVPFIPIDGTAMRTCVTLAKETAAAIASRFHLPVYLYEDAATTPARRNLADIRRGEFEGLAVRLATQEWAPDFGPAVPHSSAGATVIGARMPLIAFNVNLATPRLDIAKAVARSVRESSGGLQYVKALGVALEHRGIAQVSMNLTNFQETSIRRAFEAVRADAARHGVAVLESEIVGLVPRAALEGTSPDDLQLAGFTDRQVLETRLGDLRRADP